MIAELLAGLFLSHSTFVSGWECFWLQNSAEKKSAAWQIQNSGGSNKHVLHLNFRTSTRYWTDGTTVTRMVSIKKDHGFWGMLDSSITAGYDSDAEGTPDSSSTNDWIKCDLGLSEQCGVSYWSESGGDLLGGTTLYVVYRETATVGGVVKKFVYKMQFKVNKQEVSGDCPIDSRQVYGGPNDTWSTVDSNGQLRNLNFNPWLFRGGLFVGNMPLASRDRSGTSRTQLWFPSLSSQDVTDLKFAHVSLMHAGAPPWPNGAGTAPDDLNPAKEVVVGLWGAATTETETESTATWGNRWDPPITDGVESTNNETDPLSDVTMEDWVPGTSQRDYTNWPVTTSVSATGLTKNESALQRVLLACLDEEAMTGSISRWRYFISKESAVTSWPNPSSDPIPVGDLKPRLWAISLTWSDEDEYTP